MGPTAKDTSVSDVKQKCFQCLFGYRGKLKQRNKSRQGKVERDPNSIIIR